MRQTLQYTNAVSTNAHQDQRCITTRLHRLRYPNGAADGWCSSATPVRRCRCLPARVRHSDLQARTFWASSWHAGIRSRPLWRVTKVWQPVVVEKRIVEGARVAVPPAIGGLL